MAHERRSREQQQLLLKAVAMVALVAVAMEAALVGCGAEPISLQKGNCVACTLNVKWRDHSDFVLENVRLRDTCADKRPVYINAQAYESHNLIKRYNKKGFNSESFWTRLPGSYSPELRYLHIYCCIDGGFFGSDSCAIAVSYNPYK